VLLLVGAREVRTSASRGDMGAAFRAYMEGMMEAKRASVPALLPPGTDARAAREKAIRRYRAAVAAAPEVVRFRRELAILLGEQGRRKDALREMERVASILRRRGQTERAGEEAALWSAVYARPLTPAAVPSLRARIEALDLGWFRSLALAQLYQRAGEARRARVLRRTASDEALVQQLMLGVFGLGFLLVGTVAVSLNVYFGFRAVRRRWRFPAESPDVPAPLLWESFLLFLFLFAAFSWLSGSQATFAPRGTPVAPALGPLVARALVLDLVCLSPLLYLALQLRPLGRRVSEIGLTVRNAAGEAARGLLVYLLMLPWLLVVATVSEWIGRRFFPDVAPPFHPLVHTWALAAPSGWTRVGILLMVAVGAPLLEEIFFRGVLYTALRRRFGIAAGLLGSATVFALLHPQVPLGFLPLFFLGVVLAALYEWRRSLIPGMTLHAVQNGMIFVLLSLMFPPLD
jgi:hypothetical protein